MTLTLGDQENQKQMWLACRALAPLACSHLRHARPSFGLLPAIKVSALVTIVTALSADGTESRDEGPSAIRDRVIAILGSTRAFQARHA